MKYLLTSSQMKACDAAAIKQRMVPSPVLMERAALAAVDVLQDHFGTPERVLVLCGSGNNGGDGFAIARLLLLEGTAADVYFAGNPDSMTEEAALEKKIFENYGGKVCRNFEPCEYTVLVDALFGIGLSRPVSGEYARLIGEMNGSGRPILAVDIPSGISADNGQVLGCAVKADVTVTFAFAKPGQLLYPGAEHCGRLVVRDVGITAIEEAKASYAFTCERADLKWMLPVRTSRSNKGTCGRVLLLAGAENMAGAALLAARGAYRTGCGLVRVLSDEKNRCILQSGLPEAVFVPWQQENCLENGLPWATAVGIGPGLGKGEMARELLKKVLLLWKGPLVLDADGLNLLAENPAYFKPCEAQLIVTPHPGEMSRLTGRSVREITENLPGACMEYAGSRKVICVLKDARTVVSDGKQLYVNSSGNHGMATGGSGDVLTGIICGLLAQGMEPFMAACAAVYLHGLAGDAARDALGARAMLAGDIAEYLGKVLAENETREKTT